MKKTLLILAILLFTGLLNAQDWEVVKYGGEKYYANACYFVNADTGVYVGQAGAVVMTTDGAQSSEIVREPASTSDPSWSDVKFANESVGYACAYKGLIYKTTDSGNTWTEVGDTANYTNSLYRIAVVDENTVYVSGASGTLLKTTDGGATWNPIAFSFEYNGSVQSLDGGLAFCNANVGVVAVKTSKAYGSTWYTHDGGETWNYVQLPFSPIVAKQSVNDAEATGDSTIVIVGYGYSVFKSTDGGKTYTDVSYDASSESVYFNTIQAVNEDTYVAGGLLGHTIITTTGGATWTNIDLPVAHTIKTLHFVDTQTGYVFAEDGQWFKTVDGGANWTPILDWPNPIVKFVTSTEAGHVFLGGRRGNTSLSTDGGMTWSYLDNQMTGYTGYFYCGDFGNDNIGLIGAGSGKIYRTTDGGETWAKVDEAANPMEQDDKKVYAIRFMDENTVLAAGAKGYIIKSTDGGQTWTKLYNTENNSIYSLWVVSAKQVLAAASSGELYVSNAAVDSFSMPKDYGKMAFKDISFRGDNGVIVASKGYIFHTTKADWDTLTEVYLDAAGDEINGVTFVNDTLVYAVGSKGRIWYSQDAGLTWQEDVSAVETTLEKVTYVENKLIAVGYEAAVIMKDLTPAAPVTGLYINEFMASNDAAYADEYGDYDDWIEIYNSNDFPVDVGGLYITDDLTDPTAWQIPTTAPDTTTIPAGGFLVLWADKESEEGVLHCELKLSGGGEQIGLVQVLGSDTTFVDSLTFGDQTTDISKGRITDGGSEWGYFSKSSPGETNANGDLVGIGDDPHQVIYEYHLAQNFPNPFNPTTTIEFSLKKAGRTTLTVYSLNGQKVATLLNKDVKAGSVKVTWDASHMASGVYFYELKSGSFTSVKKMLLLK